MKIDVNDLTGVLDGVFEEFEGEATRGAEIDTRTIAQAIAERMAGDDSPPLMWYWPCCGADAPKEERSCPRCPAGILNWSA